MIALACSCLLSVGFAARPVEPEPPPDPQFTQQSPNGTFEITQYREERTGWHSKLHFFNQTRSDVHFEDWYDWPAEYNISPDGHWILQIQKSGSGANIPVLLHLESNGRIWRMEEFGERAWDFCSSHTDINWDKAYHNGAEFKGWNLKRNELRFALHAAYDNKQFYGFRREFIYDLRRNTFRLASK